MARLFLSMVVSHIDRLRGGSGGSTLDNGYLLAGTTDSFFTRPDGSFYLRAGS